MSPRWAAIGGGACGAALGSGTVAGGEWRKYLRLSGNSYFPNGDCSCRAPAACIIWRCPVGFRRCCSRLRSRPSVLLPIFASATCICATHWTAAQQMPTSAVTPAGAQTQPPRLAAVPASTTPSDTPPASRGDSADIVNAQPVAALHQQVTTLSQNYAQANANVQQANDKLSALTQQSNQLQTQLNDATARTKAMQEARDEAERLLKTSEQALNSKNGSSEQLAKNSRCGAHRVAAIRGSAHHAAKSHAAVADGPAGGANARRPSRYA